MSQSKKRHLRLWAMILTVVMLFAFLPLSILDVKAADAETNSVEIYFSLSHDANFVESKTGEVMALKKMSVPYFDLANYGLEQFYFVSETYEPGDGATAEKPSSNLKPGTADFARGKVTMLHAFIYATEVYYCGLDSDDAGEGYLKKQGLIGSDVFTPTGSTGSLFITGFWGMDLNFNYYHNYKYPLASEGWGSTADQILLHDGDIVTIGHFTSYDFHKDSLSVFNFIKAGEESATTEVEQGEQIEMTAYRAGKGENYATAHTPITNNPVIYCIPVEEADTGVVSRWEYLTEADNNGNFTVDTSDMKPGEYYICVQGQKGAEHPSAVVSTPGGIILKVAEALLSGDANNDGNITVKDLVILRKYMVDKSQEINVKNIDMNGDAAVNTKDLVLLRKALVK